MDIITRSNDERINELEAVMANELPQVDCPLNHFFTDGLYIRELILPAGTLATSKIHKTEHPYTISKGEVLVSIDKGEWVRIVAPFTGITKPGTRRVVYAVEDSVWTTYHRNDDNTQDLDVIEDRLVEPHSNPLLDNIKNIEQ